MTAAVPLRNLIVVSAVLLGLGLVLTVPLFNFDYRKFIRSSLFVKILFWIPILLVFIGILYADNRGRVAVLAGLLLAALVEFVRVVAGSRHKVFLSAYFLLFVAGLAHFPLLAGFYPARFVNLLITLCFATVLSDVTAFFCGSYLGRHKLPAWLNNRKSWEGVTGQLLGALLGVLVVNAFVTSVVSLWLFLPLGIGSAIGDLANSLAKRKAAIKDWSRLIPGHGGVIDRLSSTAGSAALMYYFLRLGGLG